MIKKRSFGFVLSGAMISLVICSVCLANEFYGGNEYICKTEYNENYIYKWSASSGSYAENNKNTFAWTAPEVNSPTDVALSVSVEDRRCGCQKNFDTAITVLPREEIKLQIQSNDTENSTSITSIDNSTFPDPTNPENITNQANLTPDALSPSSKLDDNGTSDSVNDSNMTGDTSSALPRAISTFMESEIQPTQENAKNNDSNDVIWTIPLEFGDGTEVNAVVVENSPGEFAASVDSDEGIFHLAPEEDISENSTTPENNVAPPTPQDIYQTGDQSNQTRETEILLAAIEVNNTAVDSQVQSGEDKLPPSSEEDTCGSESADNQLDADPIFSAQLAAEATPSNVTSVTPAKSEFPSA